jgi:hypothetical protein
MRKKIESEYAADKIFEIANATKAVADDKTKYADRNES